MATHKSTVNVLKTANDMFSVVCAVGSTAAKVMQSVNDNGVMQILSENAEQIGQGIAAFGGGIMIFRVVAKRCLGAPAQAVAIRDEDAQTSQTQRAKEDLVVTARKSTTQTRTTRSNIVKWQQHLCRRWWSHQRRTRSKNPRRMQT